VLELLQAHRAIDLCSPAGIGSRQAASALRGIEHWLLRKEV